MFKMKLEPTGDRDKYFRKYLSNFNKATKEGIKEALKIARDAAKVSFGKPGKPKSRTGKLHDSINYMVEAKEDVFGGYLTADTDYAEYVERRVPYLDPALQENSDKMEHIIVSTVDKRMNKHANN